MSSFAIGLIVVFTSILIGYLGGGGNVMIILQPFEWIVIAGTAIGSFIISTPTALRKDLTKNLKRLNARYRHTKEHYTQILLFIFNFLKEIQSLNDMELENHLDHPSSSQLFKKLYSIPDSKNLVMFFCDSFRIFVLGVKEPHQLEAAIDNVIQRKVHKMKEIGYSVQSLGESLPGLGIVAAVMGVIIAMGAVGSDSSVLSVKIASALVGTFAGVFLSYGIVTPVGVLLERIASMDSIPLECIKTAIVNYAGGYPPSLCLELARQILPSNFKPSITELEDAIDALNSK